MPSYFDITYPPNKPINLDGGKNNKFQVTLIDDTESPDCRNVLFEDGAVGTRGGTTKLNTTSVGSFACDGLYTRRDQDGSESMVAFFNGDMFTFNGASFSTVASAQSVFTAGVRVATAQYENHMFIGNGGVNPYKYDGDDFTRHGVPTPNSGPTASSNATGVITGDYQYKVTYVNTNVVEGDVSDATSTFTAASATIRLSSLPVAPQSYGVATRRIYRTEAGGATFKRVGTISDNTTTTFDDNNADSDLGVDAPTDQGEPPNYSIVCYHRDRLFVNDPENPNYVWYSELGEPYTFKTTNFLKIGDATGDLVKSIKPYENHIYVGGERGSDIIYMPDSDPANWSVIRIRTPYGCRSPFAPVIYNNKLMIPAVQSTKFVGFAAISGGTIDPASTPLEHGRIGSDLKSNAIEPDMFDVNETYLGDISGIVYKNRAYFSVTDGSSDTFNNRIYVWDFSFGRLQKKIEGSWVPYTNINAAQFTIYDGKLYYGTSEGTGYVYQMEDGTYNDDGSAIDSYIWTKEFHGNKGHENFVKDFRKLNVLVELLGDYNMDVVYKVNSDKGEGTKTTIDLNPGGSLWGSFTWGLDDWGGGQDREDVRKFLGATQGKRIQFKFSNQNTVDQGFKVHNLNFTYNLKGKR